MVKNNQRWREWREDESKAGSDWRELGDINNAIKLSK